MSTTSTTSTTIVRVHTSNHSSTGYFNVVGLAERNSGAELWLQVRNSSSWTASAVQPYFDGITSLQVYHGVSQITTKTFPHTALKGVIEESSDTSTTDTYTTVDVSSLSYINKCILSGGKVASGSSSKYRSSEITPGTANRIRVTANTSKSAYISFLTQSLNSYDSGDYVDFATGYSDRYEIAAGTTETLTIPSDAAYIVIYRIGASTSSEVTPESVQLITPVTTGKKRFTIHLAKS